SRLQEELASQEFKGKLLIMQSNGGVMSPQVAQRFASNTLLSGPAGAPMAGVFYGSTHNFKNVITVDMGGTSFDVALVKDATPTVTTEGQIGEHRIASPILDIHTVGAGGGSIAWVDGGGLLAVGPKSAGAEPGPACYGRGGTQATVTDAQFVLGYLDPVFFEEGEISFDGEAARKAVSDNVAKVLNMDLVTAADGIYQLVNNSMAAALGVVSVERGYDPREFVLVVAGGAGPIHAAAIARELEIPLILIPRESSVFCAAGMLISDLKHDYVRTYANDIDQINFDEVNTLFGQMAESAVDTLKSESVKDADLKIHYSADLRYVGQFNEVEVVAPESGKLDKAALEIMCQAFHDRHDALYGYSMQGAVLELINLRVSGSGRTEKPNQETYAKTDKDLASAKIGQRLAYFEDDFLETPVYDGLKLENGMQLSGPAIVVQPTTTIVVPPDFALKCDEFNNYLMFPVDEDVDALCKSLQ
ncbi:MAG: N-methylhydantoinase A, partial [Gammaproteobacteria bacterium]